MRNRALDLISMMVNAVIHKGSKDSGVIPHERNAIGEFIVDEERCLLCGNGRCEKQKGDGRGGLWGAMKA